MENTRRVMGTILAVWFSFFLMGSCNTAPGKKAKLTNSNLNKAGIDTVYIQDMKFLPGEIKVHQGDTVVWINKDLVDHCVTELKSKMWTSGVIPSGSTWKIEVKQSFNYYCAIHQVMKGKIIVE
ncbi:MAG: cupredoxin domain-containing protein [Paludibacter sp.]|nr:cupredoxin domain-containing protein [Paludibacter sp.]